MSSEEAPDSDGEAGTESTELWKEIEADVRETFGEDANVTIYDATDHLDVRILPASIKNAIESNDDDLEVVPYNAFRMTVRRDG